MTKSLKSTHRPPPHHPSSAPASASASPPMPRAQSWPLTRTCRRRGGGTEGRRRGTEGGREGRAREGGERGRTGGRTSGRKAGGGGEVEKDYKEGSEGGQWTQIEVLGGEGVIERQIRQEGVGGGGNAGTAAEQCTAATPQSESVRVSLSQSESVRGHATARRTASWPWRAAVPVCACPR